MKIRSVMHGLALLKSSVEKREDDKELLKQIMDSNDPEMAKDVKRVWLNFHRDRALMRRAGKAPR